MGSTAWVESNFFQDGPKNHPPIGFWSIPGGEMVSTGGLQQAFPRQEDHNGSMNTSWNQIRESQRWWPVAIFNFSQPSSYQLPNQSPMHPESLDISQTPKWWTLNWRLCPYRFMATGAQDLESTPQLLNGNAEKLIPGDWPTTCGLGHGRIWQAFPGVQWRKKQLSWGLTCETAGKVGFFHECVALPRISLHVKKLFSWLFGATLVTCLMYPLLLTMHILRASLWFT